MKLIFMDFQKISKIKKLKFFFQILSLKVILKQSLLFTLDCLAGLLMHKKGMDSESLFLYHANLE